MAEALRDSEARYRAFVNATSDVVYRMSPDWLQMRQLDGRGFLSDTVEPRTQWVDAYILPEDQAAVWARVRQAIAEKSVFEMEHRVRRADGGVGWTRSRAVPLIDVAGEITEWIGAAIDITAWKTSEDAARSVEDRQSFLLTLSDALRPLRDAGRMQAVAARMVGERLGAGIAYFVDVDEARDRATIRHDFTRPGLRSMAGDYPVSAFAWCMPLYRQDKPVVVDDIHTSPLVPDGDRAAMEAAQLVSFAGAPLVKDGQYVASLCVAEPSPRVWTSSEVRLLRECADRLWADVERGRAEALLHESEERFRSFAENSADTLWIVDARTGQLEYLSPAFEMMWGETRDRVMADLGRWRELVHPDDRERAGQAMPQLLDGVVTQIEYRIIRASDGTVRWVQDTGFPIRDAAGEVTRVAGVTQDVTDRRELEDRQRLLVAELQHRVRNILAVVRSIARRTAASADSAEDYAIHLDGRINALARVQAVLTRNAEGGVNLRDLLQDEFTALASEEAQVTLDGPEIELHGRTAETFALAVHELATNAVKHGALSADGGHIDVLWTDSDERLRLTWRETGVQIASRAPRRRGFGTELLEQLLPYELSAEVELVFKPGGLVCTIVMPLDRTAAPGLIGPVSEVRKLAS